MIKQRGASVLAILSYVLLFAGVLTIALRVGPLYLDNMSLDQAIASSARSNNFNAMSSSEIRDALSRTFRVNNITVNPRDFDIEKTATDLEISYVHEERVTIIGNVDVVVTFVNSYSTANN